VPKPGCQLYLVIDAMAHARERLEAAMAVADAPSVLVRIPPTTQAGAVKPLIELGQKLGAAMLILDDAALARTLRADGVHLSAGRDSLERYREAREVLGARGLIGVTAGISRHEAMSLGEAGADYIAFGAPRDLKDRPSGMQKRADMIGWWSQIIEIPCVASDVTSPEEARDVAEAGADFVTVEIAPGIPVADIHDEIVRYAAAIVAGARATASEG
jgi:thiamine-phosphate pyrophosphorylase